MKKLLTFSLLAILSFTTQAGSVRLKNCLSVNNQKVCLPDNSELFKSLKDEKNDSKLKKCFVNFMKQRLLKVKLREHDLLYFQSEQSAGGEITIVFSSKTKVPKNEH